MAKTFFFYDLETSGLNARYDRIMQFAGVRTDEKFNAIGDPVNLLIKLPDDTLPSPESVLITKITPQQTVREGLTEAEFAEYFMDEIALPDTIFTGYNNVRFDDEFMRHFLWRNFRDPYEWTWSDGRSRWDLLDVVRLVRALRPDGIGWGFIEKDGKKIPTNNLVDMARLNGFENTNAHDALADVYALIGVAKLLREKQPKMFDYLLAMRDKKSVAKLAGAGQPFVYASGRYSSEFEKTTVAAMIAPTRSGALVWDLRSDADEFAKLSEKEILANMTANYETRHADDFVPLPVKEICFNKCPAIAPLGTLDAGAQKRLKLNLAEVEKNFRVLQKNRGLIDKIAAAWNAKPEFALAGDVEGRLYDSFADNADKPKIRVVAAAKANDLADFHPNFVDERLTELLLRYKARNYPKSLSDAEKNLYEEWKNAKLTREIPEYVKKLSWIAAIAHDETPADLGDNEKKRFFAFKNRYKDLNIDDFILEELKLWLESIAP
ncbi:exodeoxyribonuclease I [Candidatus Saccharibacteria bacterium]|nr:exodeoxyribonuclease I [Candidatus Saccharibacteria bacterium]